MNDSISDTSPDMFAEQQKLLRNAGFARRFQICVSLSRFAMKQSRESCPCCRQAIGSEEWRRAYIRAIYGAEVYDDLFLLYARQAILTGRRPFTRNINLAESREATLLGLHARFNEERREVLYAYRAR